MNWSWFDLAFPWIGAIGAIVLLALLFGTNLLQGEPNSFRWRDLVWLSWMGTVAYLLHNVEEYGLDLFGNQHSFPNELCANLKLPAYPDCPITPAFFLAVNIPLFWIAAPLAAFVGRRRPLVGLAIYSVIFINGLVHIAAAVLGPGQFYNPGLLTAVLLFLPLSAWVAYACFGKGHLPYKAMALLIFGGVILHIILAGSMIMYVNGLISSGTVVSAQIINAGLLLFITWLGERWRGGVMIRPVVT